MVEDALMCKCILCQVWETEVCLQNLPDKRRETTPSCCPLTLCACAYISDK